VTYPPPQPSRAGADEIRVPLTGTIGREPVQGELRVQRIQQACCISGITVPS